MKTSDRRGHAPTWMVMTCAALGLATQGCGSGNSLYGSISQELSLQYNQVVLGVQQTTLTLTYLSSSNGTVARLAIDTNGLTLANGASVTGAQFLSNVTVGRVTTDGNNFPPVSLGTVRFDTFTTTPGSSLSGHFAVTFNNGYLLEGDFSGTLVNQNTASARLLPACDFDATLAPNRAIPLPVNAASRPRVLHALYAERSALAASLRVRPRPEGRPGRV